MTESDPGSLFTYYLFEFLKGIKDKNSENRKFFRLYSNVEKKIQDYRNFIGKPEQNITIGISDENIEEFPLWIFEGTEIFQVIEDR